VEIECGNSDYESDSVWIFALHYWWRLWSRRVAKKSIVLVNPGSNFSYPNLSK